MSKFLIYIGLLFLLINCKNNSIYTPHTMINKDKNTTEEQWKEILSPEEYYILRQKGTERPFTGQYNDFNVKGTFHCAGCDQLLFSSDTKFDSHCGWPSFDKAIPEAITYIKDTTHGMIRTEVVCSNCNGHLGHVFPDGPVETTGDRYCINSISIKFKPLK